MNSNAEPEIVGVSAGMDASVSAGAGVGVTEDSSSDEPVSLETLIENQTTLLLSIRNSLKAQMKRMDEKLDSIIERLAVLESKHLSNLGQGSTVELAKDDINVDIPKVLECIGMSHLEADKELIRHHYFNADNGRPPIRKITATTFEYWANSTWNVDNRGQEIMKILANNVRKCWLSIGNGKEHGISQDMYLKVCEHIHKFNDDKYVRELFKNILSLIP